MLELDLGDSVQGATIFAVCALIALAILISDRGRRYRSGSRWRRSARLPRLVEAAKDNYNAVGDVAVQLRSVMAASFEKRRILNLAEYRVFKIIENEVVSAQGGYRVFAQTSLGEIIRSCNSEAFFAINSKRIDILVVDPYGWPALAVEYQGSGHYQGDAAARDAIKKEALRKAGVWFLEVSDSDGDEYIRHRTREFLGCSAPSWGSRPSSSVPNHIAQSPFARR